MAGGMNAFGMIRPGQINQGYIAPTRAEVRSMDPYEQGEESERKRGRDRTPRERLVAEIMERRKRTGKLSGTDRNNVRSLVKEARAKAAARANAAPRVSINPMKNSAPSEAARRFGGGRFGGNASSAGRIR